MRLLLSSCLLLAAAFLPSLALAQQTAPAPDEALVQRAEKIVSALEIPDAALSVRIRDLVAAQYAALRPVHEARDAAIKAARATLADDKAKLDAAIQATRDTATARQAELHYTFLSRLAAELTPTQVERIKDGMTYGVLPKTFKVYQEMLPSLTPEQRTQILAWLTEAREHALCAGSSEEKHAWFGKYKGRINNYLSKAGYDMKQAERDLFARRKAAESK